MEQELRSNVATTCESIRERRCGRRDEKRHPPLSERVLRLSGNACSLHLGHRFLYDSDEEMEEKEHEK